MERFLSGFRSLSRIGDVPHLFLAVSVVFAGFCKCLRFYNTTSICISSHFWNFLKLFLFAHYFLLYLEFFQSLAHFPDSLHMHIYFANHVRQ